MPLTLTAGARLGPHEILSPLGAGGMGEVYRARDTKLKRDVALKVLPSAVASDAERLARFRREAEVLASLNHPNIAQIYGLEQSDGVIALVMELVEGEDLSLRISRGPVLADEALAIAKQIIEALEAAHEKGIIHRDLKPANIKVREDGTVKVLDFGLAKALETEASAAGRDPELSQSPTLTRQGTQTGVILGTAPYMSPEQARGKRVDKRADIWSFGVVLYEMLTGRRAFKAEDVSLTLAAVMTSEPDFTVLPEDLHPRVREVLRRCLAKDPRKRTHDICDVRLDLEAVESESEGPRRADGVKGGSSLGWRVAAIVSGIAAIVLGVIAFRSNRATSSRWPSEPIRFSITPPAGATFVPGRQVPFALSPDGRLIVFTARSSDGVARLWLRELRSEAARPLDGTENPRSPFWSPASDEIGFFSGGAMKRVPVTGGRPTTITRLPPGSRTTPTATWGADGTIVFQFSTGQGLSQVSIQTGAVSLASSFSPEDETHFSPQFLGDGRRFIYHTVRGHRIESLDGAEPRDFDFADGLGQGDATVGYVRGYLVSRRSGALVATPVDEGASEASGASFRILDRIPASGRGDVPFSVSANGVLAYWTRGIREPTVFRWIDRGGSISEPLTAPESHSGWDLAPGGDRIAFSRFDADDHLDVWIRDLNRGGEERITLDGNSAFPTWSPDGESVAYQSARAGPPDLFRYRLDGSGEIRLTDDTAFQMMESWEPSGEAILFAQFDASSSANLWRLRLGGPEAEPLSAINTEPGNEIKGQVSPDGRYIAYQSDASGQSEILVAGFPSGQPRRTVSVGGGHWPRWRADGQELFYASLERELMSVRIRASGASGFEVDPPERLFPFPANVVAATGAVDDDRPFVPASDGQRFLFLFRADDPDADPIHIIINWPALLGD